MASSPNSRPSTNSKSRSSNKEKDELYTYETLVIKEMKSKRYIIGTNGRRVKDLITSEFIEADDAFILQGTLSDLLNDQILGKVYDYKGLYSWFVTYDQTVIPHTGVNIKGSVKLKNLKKLLILKQDERENNINVNHTILNRDHTILNRNHTILNRNHYNIINNNPP